MDKVVVGIDVSKDWLDVHVAPSGEHFRVGNDHAGVEALAARLSSHGPDMVALEATGGCEHVAVAALSAAGLAVVVVNPAQVRAYANALGKHAKTDPIAAAVIAAFVEAAKPDIRPLKDKVARVFGELVTRRRQIVQMMVAEENRERMAAPGRPQEHPAHPDGAAARAGEP